MKETNALSLQGCVQAQGIPELGEESFWKAEEVSWRQDLSGLEKGT